MTVIGHGKHIIIYVTPKGIWRTKRITNMKSVHLDAYAQFRPSLIHNGGKP